MLAYGEQAAGRGLRVIIAGAGGAAHLPGMLASVTPLPVIGVPVPLRAPRRHGLAAVHRADARRRAGRDRLGRRRAQRGAARRPHPRRLRPALQERMGRSSASSARRRGQGEALRRTPAGASASAPDVAATPALRGIDARQQAPGRDADLRSLLEAASGTTTCAPTCRAATPCSAPRPVAATVEKDRGAWRSSPTLGLQAWMVTARTAPQMAAVVEPTRSEVSPTSRPATW